MANSENLMPDLVPVPDDAALPAEALGALVAGHIRGKKWADVRELLGHVATIFERGSCGRWSRKTAERKARAFYAALIKQIWARAGEPGGVSLADGVRVYLGRNSETHYQYPAQVRGRWVRVGRLLAEKARASGREINEVPAQGMRPAQWWVYYPARGGVNEVSGERALRVEFGSEWTRKHWGPDGPKEHKTDTDYPPPPYKRRDPETGRLK